MQVVRTMQSREYWQERFKELEQARHDLAEGVFKDIADLYAEIVRAMEKDLAEWYQRFADENRMSYAEAKKLLSNKELRSFKLDLKTFMEKAKEDNLSEAWQKRLENAYLRMRISRIEVIQLMLQQHLEELFTGQLDTLDSALKELYTNDYYQTAFAIQQGAGIGSTFVGVDTDKLDSVLSKPWADDGRSFSSRIWSHRDNLVALLNKEMVQAVIRGDDYRTATNNIARKMNVSRANAGRLVMTEAAFIGSRAQQNCFKALDVEQFEFVATLDKRTSEICRSMDGKHFAMSDFKIGVNAPPLHPHCRSCTAPYFDNAEDLERIARGEDGNTYKVPGDMTYEQWREKYIKGIQGANGDGIIKTENLSDVGVGYMDLEQAKKRDHKIMINEIAISKVPLVRVNGLSLAECELLQSEHKKLLQIAMEQNESDEVLTLLSMDTRNSVRILGTETGVSPLSHPEGYSAISAAKSYTLAFLHNHPSTNNFSLADIVTFVQAKEIGIMSVVTNQGEVYLLRKNTEFSYQKVLEVATKAYNAYNSRAASHDEAVKMFLKDCTKWGVSYERSK